MKVLITGSAGFIGFHLASRLLDDGYEVHGVDNLNDYYDVSLKKTRLKILRNHDKNKYFHFYEQDICNKNFIDEIFAKESFDKVLNLAAQAGVRYSIEAPLKYIDSNINGFMNILENCRRTDNCHLVFASSSSVYGMNKKQPFSVDDNTDHPVSLYAATKKSNEALAFSYSHLYSVPTTCLRFFTVYGPYGRPDMAYFNFTDSILNNKQINLFNNGKMKRDFTYIDDIVDGIVAAMHKVPIAEAKEHIFSDAPYKTYNLGNNKPVELLEFVREIEKNCNQKAKIKKLPMQLGDVKLTYASITESKNDLLFEPKVSIKQGIKMFVDWYKSYIS